MKLLSILPLLSLFLSNCKTAEPIELNAPGSDSEGYLYSYNGDRMPKPSIQFDLSEYFPLEARQAGIQERMVVVIVQIDEEGNLRGAKIGSEKIGFGFDEAALKIVERATWQPGILNGKPIKMHHRVPVIFRLN
ncbi:energy transducer TonB [Leptospira gomenensis]|uniref:Energy transducer TonB n=1 Tax=Leptospira gomenensis TaxID=2484974 RepID=A0A5F1YBS5_9LEPT|nr:energy transducer TonB [Leptospira gomenensis]TGK33837.1 energy transducer TonB [Leptospira gomenensis]TGK36349.1 energy transducer TonB [Leptospira gomenensis]TGK40224.1 energy transducer TonB [Leptospira gomenensis]TGK59889.1 energy transducer TonB [Leptospira gomenensis]